MWADVVTDFKKATHEWGSIAEKELTYVSSFSEIDGVISEKVYPNRHFLSTVVKLVCSLIRIATDERLPCCDSGVVFYNKTSLRMVFAKRKLI